MSSARSNAPSRRIPRQIVAATAALSLLAAGTVGAASLQVVAAPVAHAATSSTVDGAVSAGTLSWGIKESFRSYLKRPFVAGTISTSGGASQAANNGVFAFTSGAGTLRGGVGTIAFQGTVRIQGHHGEMDMSLSNPRVVLTSGTAGELRLDAKVPKTSQTAAFVKNNAVIARISFGGAAVASGKLELKNAAVVLTADGEKAFGGFYPVGTVMDPLGMVSGFAARTATALKASAATSQFGTAASLSASGVPAGAKVTFKRGSTTLGTATANARGAAALKAKAGGVGTQRLTASYAGSASKKPATVAFNARVTKRVSATRLSAAAFAKNTKAKAVVTIPRLADGTYASGRVSVTWSIPGRKAVTANYTLAAKAKGKLSVTAPHPSAKSVGVRAGYAGSSTTTASASAQLAVRVR